MSDLRTEKTKENIYQAFFTLAKDRTFDEITIEQLCRIARCSRSTFYSHYDSKKELFSELLEHYVSEFALCDEKFFSEDTDFVEFINTVIQNIILPNKTELSILFPLETAGLSLSNEYEHFIKSLFLKYFPQLPSKEIFSDLLGAIVTVIFRKVIDDKLDETDFKNLSIMRKLVWHQLREL